MLYDLVSWDKPSLGSRRVFVIHGGNINNVWNESYLFGLVCNCAVISAFYRHDNPALGILAMDFGAGYLLYLRSHLGQMPGMTTHYKTGYVIFTHSILSRLILFRVLM